MLAQAPMATPSGSQTSRAGRSRAPRAYSSLMSSILKMGLSLGHRERIIRTAIDMVFIISGCIIFSATYIAPSRLIDTRNQQIYY